MRKANLRNRLYMRDRTFEQIRRWKREYETRLQHRYEEECCSQCGEVLLDKSASVPRSVAMMGTECVVMHQDPDLCDRCYMQKRGN